MWIRALLWAGLIALSWVCVVWRAPAVEHRLEARANTLLDSVGATDARVQMQGRRAVLTGTVASTNDERRLVREIERLWGVRDVVSTVARRDRQVQIQSTASRAAPAGGAAPMPASVAPPPTPALETPEATALTGELAGLLRDQRIEFRLGSEALSDEGGATVDAVAGMLARAPGLIVEIGGHTDNAGTAQFNLDLSRRRAHTVSLALEARGVPSQRVVPVGFGASRPRSTNRTEKGRAHNRRIEFRVIGETEG